MRGSQYRALADARASERRARRSRRAGWPRAALLIAWAAGAARETGEAAALWCAVGSVIALELAAGIRSRATRRELALELGVGIALGLGILALRVLLHH